MLKIVSITSQGQITIPKAILRTFGIRGATKAAIKQVGKTIIIEPRKDFWSLESSLVSKVKLSDAELKKARQIFSRKWVQKENLK
jgi:AbrB family looped-hinge helix DNA binding protein